MQERDLDPEVMRQTRGAYQNLSKLEKIQRFSQMDLLEEFHLLQNLSARYMNSTCPLQPMMPKMAKTSLCQKIVCSSGSLAVPYVFQFK